MEGRKLRRECAAGLKVQMAAAATVVVIAPCGLLSCGGQRSLARASQQVRLAFPRQSVLAMLAKTRLPAGEVVRKSRRSCTRVEVEPQREQRREAPCSTLLLVGCGSGVTSSALGVPAPAAADRGKSHTQRAAPPSA